MKLLLHLLTSLHGPKLTCRTVKRMSDIEGEADIQKLEPSFPLVTRGRHRSGNLADVPSCGNATAPTSLPLFEGLRLLGGEQFSFSDMIVLLCYEDLRACAPAQGHETMSAFGGLGSSGCLAANWVDPNDPKAT